MSSSSTHLELIWRYQLVLSPLPGLGVAVSVREPAVLPLLSASSESSYLTWLPHATAHASDLTSLISPEKGCWAIDGCVVFYRWGRPCHCIEVSERWSVLIYSHEQMAALPCSSGPNHIDSNIRIRHSSLSKFELYWDYTTIVYVVFSAHHLWGAKGNTSTQL